ncbi:MAG: nucleotidyltransferase domain-containing protein [Bacteroidia bacterium]|nr:nucleotidyltransferase domain-containing protein [Bacteroidia bacterium]
MDKETVFGIAEKYLYFLTNEKKYDIKKAYIFGSYAKGIAHDESDIDIAVILPYIDDIFDLQVQMMLLRRNFSIDIEPHPIQEEDFNIMNPLAYEIMKTGIEIQIRNHKL